jgi:hypothetical protein
MKQNIPSFMYFSNAIDKKFRLNSMPKNGKIFNVKKIKMDKTKLIVLVKT